MYFNLDVFADKYAMHCKTEKEAIDFCTYLHKNGRCWRSGDFYIDDTMWDRHGDSTVYYFNVGTCGNIHIAKEEGYTILEWSNYMDTDLSMFTKADLKTGDVLLRRDGTVEIYNGELDMFILQKNWNNPYNTRLDLTSKINKNADIMAVRRPFMKSDCVFEAFEKGCERGALVYQRKEVEEMTLKEVCKLLGKEIKIIPG